MDNYSFEVRHDGKMRYSISNVKLNELSEAWSIVHSLAEQHDLPGNSDLCLRR